MGIKGEILILSMAFLCVCVIPSSTHPVKFGHASGGRGGGRGGSQSHSPNMQRGSGVVPLYVAAGAANNHHNNHVSRNRSMCSHNRLELVHFAFTILVCLLL
ncbi:PREDICTED: uncharacterized protein LOC105958291 isoform X2 [Erythranthe guttata]|uniref:uncharacterized protein LOC105958291 isoform X2 n=1 Tax=Erythranthe guttata TaxID=4155 RepID=UPI00064D88E3|nr:PREDICTED: uncharacterized protein LOC105958291 isoform X2 [Erythranthe guttata]|eukprot:XP_012837753.1 PREDICTED: uncharacterized protein LOC105958291 isoform X2 [Erythranthe guttata]